ncbi:hypothetical protein F0562_001103 [Nyssa sinensis]|uniref:PHD-type domain-containing protein n=1 Tax=Nyssa sinensis TaxID=561372 RepID=A0A5J5C3P6_9ASTE|nr:hypothetical protein F0562_001103 [Nyssa sinensis]
MAADTEQPACTETSRKRRKVDCNAKLLVNDRVEVRSVEKGFLGSWNSGTVIACEYLVRRVQYDNLLCDDGTKNVIHCVGVTPVIEGILSAASLPSNYRAWIRPLPPTLDFGKCCLHYGQCVDVHYKEAWWEGVIFDHEDASEKRKIFFPDMGDVMEFEIERLRITQDWDEFTEDWKPRRNWLFLELIGEFGQECPLVVSVRQIWYDVRESKGFEKLKEWTSCVRDLWKELICEVIQVYFKLTLMDFFHGLGSSKACSLLTKNLNDASVPLFTNDLNNASVLPIEEEIDWDDLTSILEDDRLDMNLLSSSKIPCHQEMLCVQPPTLSFLPSNPNEFSSISSSTKHEGYSSSTSKMPNRKLSPSTQRKIREWLPAGPDWVPGAEFCPDAVTKYNHFTNSKKKPSLDLTLNFRKHLAYLGWKIEFFRDKSMTRLRYTSPDGKYDKRSSSTAPDGPISSPHIESPQVRNVVPVVHSPGFVDVDPEYCSQALVEEEKTHDWLPAGHDLVPGAEFCPDAVTEYNRFCNSKNKPSIALMLNARKHLAYLGWKIEFHREKGVSRLRYTSPDGICYLSLRRVCQDLSVTGFEITSLISKDVNGSSSTARSSLISSPLIEHPQAEKVDYYSSTSQHNDYYRQDDEIKELRSKAKKHLSAVGWSFWYIAKGARRELRYTSPRGKDYISLRTACKGCMDEAVSDSSASTCMPRQHKNFSMQNAGFPVLKKVKASRSLIKLRNDWDGDAPNHVPRSSQRVWQRAVSSSSQHNPRTVLSWLIENNVVLPGEKVRYCGKKDHRPMAEGWITHEGVKCSCCDKIFTLSKFEAHAGSTNHRPSANIFLEDGRSLFDCQLQLKRNNNLRSFRTEPHDMKGKRHHSANDCICSICHFGGELLLCDQCPSSFHTTCLGLMDVPDGDWFCPSCCCGICGQSRFSEDTGQFNDNIILNCVQCEHHFHVGCLRKGGLIKLDNYPKGNWFCGKRCEQIFLGLRELLGKSVPVGKDNLTWTLLKYMKCDGDHNASDNEALMENYSKLNVALGVMHECFEPVKESHMRRDLIEDVIFSRWSELKRLNFQGFYTVLLERNDELITVATVRVYGEKVAEVPLIGTRFQYRRLGMCRILMNELEKNLMELGVERLVLPAAPGVLNTWTTTFGFSKMTKYERLNFVDYTFLDFQGTIMCQKLLMKIHSTELLALKGTQQTFHDDINGSNNS